MRRDVHRHVQIARGPPRGPAFASPGTSRILMPLVDAGRDPRRRSFLALSALSPSPAGHARAGSVHDTPPRRGSRVPFGDALTILARGSSGVRPGSLAPAPQAEHGDDALPAPLRYGAGRLGPSLRPADAPSTKRCGGSSGEIRVRLSSDRCGTCAVAERAPRERVVAPCSARGGRGRDPGPYARRSSRPRWFNVTECTRCRGEGRCRGHSLPRRAAATPGRAQKPQACGLGPGRIDEGHQIRLPGGATAGPRAGHRHLYGGRCTSAAIRSSVGDENANLPRPAALHCAGRARPTAEPRDTTIRRRGQGHGGSAPGNAAPAPGSDCCGAASSPHLRAPGTRGDLQRSSIHLVKRADRSSSQARGAASTAGRRVGRGGATGRGIIDRMKDALG